jgi:superfamily II DNA or RNA helicase
MKSKNKGILYELVVAEKLKDRGYTNVKITKASHDYGADILAFKNGLEHLFQCKEYKGTVGNKAVQEVSSAMEVYRADKGYVVCDTKYSKPAKTTVAKSEKLIELLTLDQIKAWPKIKTKPIRFDPHPYQRKTLTKLKQHRKNGKKIALVVMATSLGKTLVSAWDLNSQLKKGGKALFLAHRKDIVVENAEKFNSVINEKSLRFKLGVCFSGKKIKDEKIVFSTFQTIRTYMHELPKGFFDYIIIDEAHHSPAKTYAEVINYFTPGFCLGLTATPQRLTKKDNEFIENKFGLPVENLDLAESLCKGYLSPVKYSVFCDNIDFKKLKAAKKKLSLEQLNKSYFIPTKDEDIEEIIEKEKEKIKNPKTIIFCPSIKYISAVKSIGVFREAEVYHSNINDFDRELIFRNFKTGKIKTLLVVDLFNEGIDIPDANLIVFLRTTFSPTVFFQQLGRGLRKLTPKVKPYLRVLDFVGVFKALKSIANIYGHLLLIKDFQSKVRKAQSRKKISGGRKQGGGLEPLELSFYQAGNKLKHKENIYIKKSFLDEIELINSFLRKSESWTESEIMEELSSVAKKLKKFPSSKDLLKLKKFDLSVAVSRNGGYPYFALKLGYPLKEKPKGFWKNPENVKSELQRVYDAKGYIPSGRGLEDMGLSTLAGSISKLGVYKEVVRGFGFPYEDKQTEPGTWSDKEKFKKELALVCGKEGVLPQTQFLRDKKRNDLITVIKKEYGSFFKASQSLGLSYAGRKPPGYYGELANIKKEIRPYCKGENLDILPSHTDLVNAGRKDLTSVISKNFKSNKDATEKLGFVYDGRKPEGYWDKFSTLKNELNDLFDEYPELKKMPTQEFLSKIGRADLNGAIARHGGIHKVAEKLKLKTEQSKRGKFEQITNVIKELKKVIKDTQFNKNKKIKTIPNSSFLRDNGYSSLSTAIMTKHGGFEKVANIIGFIYEGPKPQGYWQKWENVQNELLKIVKDPEKFPTQSELEKLDKKDLLGAIKSNWGGILKVKKKFLKNY